VQKWRLTTSDVLGIVTRQVERVNEMVEGLQNFTRTFEDMGGAPAKAIRQGEHIRLAPDNLSLWYKALHHQRP
jgi:hypothetical protein